ncbi:MAG TPA: hypothetical protein PKC99_10275 [Anaerolineales bacterium]|nr:tetratricopeptide repeat protein [Anaerolineae bacterium]MBL1172408.1 tetratricopeptide repeat protein [Chloroflexota bacterium]MDL1925007.1 tetratricopeptide repeat protein [Anaerolineae bacterium AMX1]WKZ53423.1 MAG: hypothetical protein QY324_11375 [Anaerolineales bacterium]NOG75891.1 tetratricopeptide repeat protein [Chloroflexota bacterium]
MSDISFLATRRAPMLVNRASQLKTIQEAIYRPDASCNILFIRGQGGMGKSRLSEEILWRGGNVHSREVRGPIPASHPEWDWTNHGQAVIGDLIDVSAPRLHARAPFMRAIRDALVWPGSNMNFTRYDSAYDRFQGKRFYMGDFQRIQEIGQEIENEFLNDYLENSKLSRIVLVFDTVEKLYPIGGTELLLEEGLLRPEDMQFYTYQWLLKQIREGGFPNTTLILVGRNNEGKSFFDAIDRAASSQPDCKLTPMADIDSFQLEDTRTYFQAIIEAEKDHPEQGQIVATMKNIVKDDERLETLWIYTGGQPVRLALYTDLIIEDSAIPDRLQESPEQARKSQQIEGDIKRAQKEIESGFIRLLFARPNLRAEILKALVRAPRGLNTEQLHYCFHSDPNEPPKAWLERKAKDSELLRKNEQIEKELDTLRNLTIVKIRPDGRLGLQDEIYRIYTNALAGDERGRKMEQDARQKLYAKLESWAQHQYQEKLEELTEIQANAERQLHFERPSLALEVRLPIQPKRQLLEHITLRIEIQQWELEDLHYSLLQDFTTNFNNELFELADQKWTANDEDADAVIRAELWQLLEDPAYALKEFGKIEEWESLKKRNEEPLHAFKRFALQNDASDWIKRFDLRKDFSRAIEFAEKLEDAIKQWSREKVDDANFFIPSWQNTLTRSERALWRDYARILAGIDVDSTLEKMGKQVQELEKLLQAPQSEMVFPDRNETGFKDHPAETKLRRIASIYYNYLGYGYANQGNSSQARDAYGRALLHMREEKSPDREATTRNNLARVLSDRGHTRGRRLCLDALELRKKQGAEVPIAYSYNTLALIDNDHSRPDLAWIEAAIATAYFDLAEDQRGLGLSLLQLSEALRRLAKRKSEPYHLRGDTPEIVLETAKRAIDQAIDIFTRGDASHEKIRRVEAWIEKACLERDLIQFIQNNPKQKQRHNDDALYYLDQAVNLAKELNNFRLELDARVDIAWTHYHFRKYEQAESILTEIEKKLPADCQIKKGNSLPSAERDDLYVYYQLSKMHGLRGRMALDQFNEFTNSLKNTESDKEKRHAIIRQDSKAKQLLQKVADAFVLALAYAQLLSPRSSALTIIYDSCYEHIKSFNPSELEGLHKFVVEAREKFGVSKIKIADFGDLSEFLIHTFGLSNKG